MKPNLPSWTPNPAQGASPRTEFPSLAHLLDGWFHQDYSYEGENLSEIVLSYRRAVSGDDRLQTAGDIDRFLAKYNGEEHAIAKALEDGFQPEVTIEGWDGMTTKQWLQKVSELLTRPAPPSEPLRPSP